MLLIVGLSGFFLWHQVYGLGGPCPCGLGSRVGFRVCWALVILTNIQVQGHSMDAHACLCAWVQSAHASEPLRINRKPQNDIDYLESLDLGHKVLKGGPLGANIYHIRPYTTYMEHYTTLLPKNPQPSKPLTLETLENLKP